MVVELEIFESSHQSLELATGGHCAGYFSPIGKSADSTVLLGTADALGTPPSETAGLDDGVSFSVGFHGTKMPKPSGATVSEPGLLNDDACLVLMRSHPLTPESDSPQHRCASLTAVNPAFISFPDLVQQQQCDGVGTDFSQLGTGVLNVRAVSAPPARSGRIWMSEQGAARCKRNINQCSNCSTTSTPFWRRMPNGQLACNACGLYYKTKHCSRPITLQRNNGRRVKNRDYQCTNCFTTTTPLWRRGKDGSTVCNACGLYLKVRGINRPLKGKDLMLLESADSLASLIPCLTEASSSEPFISLSAEYISSGAVMPMSSPALPCNQSATDGSARRCFSVVPEMLRYVRTAGSVEVVQSNSQPAPVGMQTPMIAPTHYSFASDVAAPQTCTNNPTPPPDDMLSSLLFLAGVGTQANGGALQLFGDQGTNSSRFNHEAPAAELGSKPDASTACVPSATNMPVIDELKFEAGREERDDGLFEALSQHVSDFCATSEADVWDNFVF